MLGGLVWISSFVHVAMRWHTTPLRGRLHEMSFTFALVEGWKVFVWFRNDSQTAFLRLHSLFTPKTIALAGRNGSSGSDVMAKSIVMNFEWFVIKFQVAAVCQLKSQIPPSDQNKTHLRVIRNDSVVGQYCVTTGPKTNRIIWTHEHRLHIILVTLDNKAQCWFIQMKKSLQSPFVTLKLLDFRRLESIDRSTTSPMQSRTSVIRSPLNALHRRP